MKGILFKDGAKTRIEVLGFVPDRHGFPDAIIRIEGEDPYRLKLLHWSCIIPDDPHEMVTVIERLTPVQECSFSASDYLDWFEKAKKESLTL